MKRRATDSRTARTLRVRMKSPMPKRKIGDYTRERRTWLKDKSVPAVTARIHARKKSRA